MLPNGRCFVLNTVNEGAVEQGCPLDGASSAANQAISDGSANSISSLPSSKRDATRVMTPQTCPTLFQLCALVSLPTAPLASTLDVNGMLNGKQTHRRRPQRRAIT